MSEKMRIKIKGFEHQQVDEAIKKIIASVRETGAKVHGPIPLPTHKEIITILRAVHKYKDSREQFEKRTHKRMLEISELTPTTIDVLKRIQLPSSVNIEIKNK